MGTKRRGKKFKEVIFFLCKNIDKGFPFLTCGKSSKIILLRKTFFHTLWYNGNNIGVRRSSFKCHISPLNKQEQIMNLPGL
jgi:hypothetical protein